MTLRFRRALPKALLAGSLGLAGCGVGDEVILGRFPESGGDGSSLDGGPRDAGSGTDGGEGGRPSGDAGDGDGHGAECNVPESRSPIKCEQMPLTGNSPTHIKWRFPPASLGLKQQTPPGTPLVANLTDDNGDGKINLCDVPDVLLVAGESAGGGRALWMLAGDSGRVERLFDKPLFAGVSPAIADLEGDGVPEIIAIDPDKHLIALRPDGTQLWQGAEVTMPAGVQPACYAVSVYDVDADGRAEILAGYDAFDVQGNRRSGVPTSLLGWASAAVLAGCVAPIAADLTGDGQLEMLFGHATLGPDGKQLWQYRIDTPSIPVVANLDAEPGLEVVLVASKAVYVLEADGRERATLTRSCTTNVPTVHDFNGDGIDEVALPDCDSAKRATVYQLQDNNLVPRWSVANLLGSVGTSSVASFDFDGSGSADLLYADEQASALYAGADGRMIFEALRVGQPVVGTPVIVDVDNDGSTELLLPAFQAGDPSILTVISGEVGAWMSTRRIWNQHAYHVTNVHEDARIPRGTADAPQIPLRMRSNAHRQGNQICVP